MFELAGIADEYGNGELRITVEQNLTLPNVPSAADKPSPRPKPAPWSSRWSWTPPWKPAPFGCISLDAPTLTLKCRLRILDSWERWHETRIGSPRKASIFILGAALAQARIWRIGPAWYDWYPSHPVATCCVRAHD